MSFWKNYFEPKYFFIAFFVGMFMTYITVPTPEVILKYPTPINSGKIVYQDLADTCYVYESEQIPCPKKGVTETPLQYKKKEEDIVSKLMKI